VTAQPTDGPPPTRGARRPDTGRAAAQRERILAAAQRCFVEQGFHAASIAAIAATADISQGLIYRYFAGKNAIVLAIIERQLGDARRRIAELHASTDIAGNLARALESWRTGDPVTGGLPLFLAMSVEARRDPQIAAALRESDRRTREDFESWLGRHRDAGGRGLRKDVVASRALLMQCVIEGLAIRALREPDLDAGRLSPALRRLFDQLLAP
jgi:AcrR family transcriptional regulator